MATVLGARHTENINQDTRRIDMVPTIKELEPDETPLTVLTMMIPSAPTGNPEFSWIEDKLPPRFDAINLVAGYTASDTNLVVDNGPYFGPNELWKVTRTGEIVRVTAIAGNTITVVRGVGGGAAAILDNDELMITGIAFEENSQKPQARSDNPTKVTNYTQIHRHTVEMSETMRGQEQFTRPHDWDFQVSKKMKEHKIGLEQAYLHNKPSEDAAAPRRTTGGALHFITSNLTDAGGVITEDEFFGAFSNLFRYGDKSSKVALASRLAVNVVNGYPRGKLELTQADNDSTYGLSVMNYRHAHGTLKFITHNLLEGSKFGGYIVILDIAQLRKRPMRSKDGGTRDTFLEENVETPGQDGRVDVITTETGLEFGLAQTHGLISNITG